MGRSIGCIALNTTTYSLTDLIAAEVETRGQVNTIERIENRVVVTGELRDFHYFLTLIHTIVEKLVYQEVILDLQKCTSAFQNAMLSVCAQVMAYRKAGVSLDLIPPADTTLLNLFKNSNWGHYLDPRRFDPSNFRGHTKIPATQYTNPTEQQAAVNRIVNVMLGALPDLERSDFAAFEWAVNELTDNVLVHANSPIGGLVQVSTFSKFQKRVQFVVADAGIGIPTSLRQGRFPITSDTDALDQAIREGVTRDADVGQGNGLFGSYQICSESRGEFLVDSGHARLSYRRSNGLSISSQNIPYKGTLIVATIDFSDPSLLADALKFGGQKYTPIDYVDTKYTQEMSGEIHFKLNEECTSFGSRVSGKPVRVKLMNLTRMSGTSVVRVDFDGVPLVSSSFADEAIAKLFLAMSPVAFMHRIKLSNMHNAVEGIINKAISQRLKVGTSDAEE